MVPPEYTIVLKKLVVSTVVMNTVVLTVSGWALVVCAIDEWLEGPISRCTSP